ncbi:hypothetical protein GmHk_01G001981 [Glycine max]|nr:hypothetical protein GmHk_01G001981 [Glycine max]
MMVRRMDDDALMVGMGAEPHAWRSRCSYWRDTYSDHPLKLATDDRLGRLLSHQLANQVRVPPLAYSSFCSSVCLRFLTIVLLPRIGSYTLLTGWLVKTPLLV